RAVQKEAWPQVAGADELHDALLLSGVLTAAEGHENGWELWFAELSADGRVAELPLDQTHCLWLAAERLPQFQKLYPGKVFRNEPRLPEALKEGIAPE